MEKTEWKVEGMTCANCALTISKYLQKQGFNEIKINLAEGDVSFVSPEKIEEKNIKKGIERLGYSIATDASPNRRWRFLKTPLQKFWFCLPFTLVLMLHMLPQRPHWLMHPWLQLLLCLPVYITGMSYFGRSAVKSIRGGIPNMNVLIALGATAAFVYSLAGTLMGAGHQFLYYESAATIITFVFLGYWLEDISVRSTQKTLRSLSAEQKVMANMIAFDHEHKEQIFPVESSQLRVGDLVLIKTGEKIPADCKILWGDCTANEAIITGESLPVRKGKKDFLIGGSIIESGTVKTQVTATGNNSVLGKILELAKQAQSDKPPIQQLADRISAVFVPAVLLIALLAVGINLFAIHLPFGTSLMRGIAVLVIACPCAMGLATPAAVAVGLGRAAKNGILFKDAKSLELFKNIKQVVFDKTGTITTGNFEITGYGFQDVTEDEFKKACYSIEKFSSHPIAACITRTWKVKDEIKWNNIEEVKGFGVKATDNDGNTYTMGSDKMMPPPFDKDKPGHNVFFFKNNRFLGWIDVADEIRAEARDVVNYFRLRGIKTTLLSGDKLLTCKKLADDLGIDEVYAEQSPVEKMNTISRLDNETPVAMIGDGINDAPALARATIGISLTDASHIAIQNARIILMNNGLKQLPLALALGRHTYSTIRQNLFWAFIYNVAAIPVAAAGLLTPGFAALAMGFSDMVLAANSIRLKWKKVM